MKYLLMIYISEAAFNALSPEAAESLLQQYSDFTARHQSDGILLGGERLHPVDTATTVRVRNNKTLTTDGPYAETKEQLGGYFLVDCRDLDDAINAMDERGVYDTIKVQRLKKRKLALKDQISRLENSLVPDIIA